MKEKRPLSTTVLAITACLLWSTAFAGIKIGLQYTTPLSFAGIRFMLAGVLILPFCLRNGSYFRTVRVHIRLIVVVAFFQTFLLYAFFYTGMTLVSGALAAIVIGASPLISAVTAHLFTHDDKLSPLRIVSIGVGIAGVVIISLGRQPWSAAGLKELLGITLLLLCSASSALGNLAVSRYDKAMSSMILTSSQIFLGGFVLLLISIPLEGLPGLRYPLPFYPALLWLSFLSAAAFTIWFSLLRRPGVQVSGLNIWKFILPVFGALFSWLLLPDESPDFFSVAGMVCVAVAVVFYNRISGGSRRKKTVDGKTVSECSGIA